jgi:hypothetical protein
LFYTLYIDLKDKSSLKLDESLKDESGQTEGNGSIISEPTMVLVALNQPSCVPSCSVQPGSSATQEEKSPNVKPKNSSSPGGGRKHLMLDSRSTEYYLKRQVDLLERQVECFERIEKTMKEYFEVKKPKGDDLE